MSKQAGNLYLDKIPASARNAASQAGSKTATLFEQFKNSKIVSRLGVAMGTLQLKAPVHLIDILITYAIGVVSGMQDMAQVCLLCSLFQTNNSHTHTCTCTCTQHYHAAFGSLKEGVVVPMPSQFLTQCMAFVALVARPVHSQVLKQAVLVA